MICSLAKVFGCKRSPTEEQFHQMELALEAAVTDVKQASQTIAELRAAVQERDDVIGQLKLALSDRAPDMGDGV